MMFTASRKAYGGLSPRQLSSRQQPQYFRSQAQPPADDCKLAGWVAHMSVSYVQFKSELQ